MYRYFVSSLLGYFVARLLRWFPTTSLLRYPGTRRYYQLILLRLEKAKPRVEPLSATPVRAWLMGLRGVSHRAHRQVRVLEN